jgi:acylphosphatase
MQGYVKNLADGSVQVVAEGARALLEQLLGELRQGPTAARVDEARAEWSDPTGEFNSFSIR